MKLTDIRPEVESSGELQEQFFSIKDQGMIFDILRNKMYSNPILAICREITSNARDAHREVGTPDVSVNIHLPTNFEPDFKIKDFGPGISPDRMSNVFIQYTASTKRNDNIQTGGFGLGAKTPFSYSDTFTIVTNHNGIKYNYACFIDETKVGKLALFSQEKTTEPNGTEISIPVKPQDFTAFKQYTEQACRHWTVRPTITGGDIQWTNLHKVLEGNNWAIASNNNYNRVSKLIIDHIEYPLELETLRKYANSKLIDWAHGNFVMYFGVGELSLSASREQIYLDKPTQEKIRLRLEEIELEIKDLISTKIESFPNFWDANVFYRKELSEAFSSLDFLGPLFWKGKALSNNGYLHLKCKVYNFNKGKHTRKYGSDPNKINRSLSNSLYFEESSEVWINDLLVKELTLRHIKKAFDDNARLTSIQVICPDGLQSEAELNNTIHLNLMNPKRLSSITKVSGRKYTTPASRLLVFKFEPQMLNFRQVSYDSMDEDSNEKILCYLTKDSYGNNRQAILSTKKIIGPNALKALLERNPKISFYGLDKNLDPTRIKEEFSDFKELEIFVEEKLLKNKTINYVEIKFAQHHTYHVDDKMLKHLIEFETAIKDPKSEFLIRLNLHKEIKKLSGTNMGMLDLYESIKGSFDTKDLTKFVTQNPEWDIDKSNQKYKQKYPLLDAIHTYNISDIVEHIAHYVNAIDKI